MATYSTYSKLTIYRVEKSYVIEYEVKVKKYI